jgi:hypothetical protein
MVRHSNAVLRSLYEFWIDPRSCWVKFRMASTVWDYTVSVLPSVTLGLIPMDTERRRWPVEGFWMFDLYRLA